MSFFSINKNPFGMILIVLPTLTFIVSLILQLLMKKKTIILAIVFIVYLVATYTVFNSSFLIWCFVYTVTSLIGTIIADLILKYSKKRNN